MPTKRKEMIILTEKIMGDIYLEPEEEIIKNAKNIAEASKSAEKYIFRIVYEADEKSVILSEIKRLECETLEHSDAKSCVTIKANMDQLTAIKSLDCVNKVEMEDVFVAETAATPTENFDNNIAEVSAFTEQVSLAAMEDEAISTMCYGGDSGSDCENSNTMQTAYYLPISSWVNGCICCPGTEIWYKFTASASNAAEYTIYTSGSLDTMGYLYSSNGTLITSNDDGGGSLNFSITEELTYGATYYVKVKAYGSNTGNYNIRVGYTTQSSSGGGNDSDGSNDQASAIQLTLNSWQSGEICCPDAEIWYKFTPGTSAYYTVYTIGSLDTYGYLYDSNSNQIDSDDDNGTGMNFKMVYHLTANQTYYIRAKAYGNSTGSFSIAVTDTVFVESVMIDASYVTLNKDETATLSATVLPSYATNKTIRWESSDTGVVTVNASTGKITAVNGGSACVTAYSQDGSGKSSCCAVVVNVLIETVTVDTSTRLMHVGEGDWFTATVCPENASNKLLYWTSSDTAVASVHPATGYVTAKAVGTVDIYATAQDGTGKRGVCVLTVEPVIPVQSITMCADKHTMLIGETQYMSYDIYPPDATNQTVAWSSTDTSVAEVNANTGRISAKAAGTATITVTTNDGSFVASCIVKVVIDIVTIQKDGNFFSVQFQNGLLWKSVEYDLGNDDFSMYVPQEAKDRRSYNMTQLFSAEQLAFLYLLDPLGVGAYLDKCFLLPGWENRPLEDSLFLKDAVFREIFGVKPQLFRKLPNGTILYYENQETITGEFRKNVYSTAEIIFGTHVIYDLVELVDFVIDVITGLFTMLPYVSEIILGIDIVKALFFSGAIQGTLSSGATIFLDKYVEKYVTNYGYSEDYVRKNLIEEIYKSMIYDKMIEYLVLKNTFITEE